MHGTCILRPAKCPSNTELCLLLPVELFMLRYDLTLHVCAKAPLLILLGVTISVSQSGCLLSVSGAEEPGGRRAGAGGRSRAGDQPAPWSLCDGAWASGWPGRAHWHFPVARNTLQAQPGIWGSHSHYLYKFWVHQCQVKLLSENLWDLTFS